MQYKSIIFFQSIEHIRDFLDLDLWDFKKVISIDDFYIYLIARTLFKTGSYNAYFLNNPYFDVVREKISKKYINSPDLRYIDNLILDYVNLPKTKADEYITFELKGSVLIAKYNNALL